MLLRRAKAVGLLIEYEYVSSSLGLPARARRLHFTVIEIKSLKVFLKANMQDVQSVNLPTARQHYEKRDG